MPCYNEKTGGLLLPPEAASKPAWETFSRLTGECQASCGISPATSRINQHSSQGRLTPHFTHTHTKTKLNNKQGHTLQAKSLRRGKTLTPPHLQPAQRISTSLNRETRRAPRPPVTRAQMAWEDADKVSFVVPWVLPQTSLGQSSIAPWTDRPPPRDKKRN
jgi:hypothetical protein